MILMILQSIGLAKSSPPHPPSYSQLCLTFIKDKPLKMLEELQVKFYEDTTYDGLCPHSTSEPPHRFFYSSPVHTLKQLESLTSPNMLVLD